MVTSDISQTMKQVGLHQFLLSLIAVPMGIVVARMVARVVTLAIVGDVKNTCVTAAVLTGAVIIWRIVTAFAQAALAREKSKAVQECRMSTYRKLLELPLDRLYRNERGQSMEGLTDDLNRVVKRETELVPGLFISIITVASYGVFIAYYSPVTAGLFLLISLLQLLPPVIVRKYMQVNYEDCREIEAKLDGFLLEAYRGFSTVKLYGLTEWMIQKLKALHTDYTRIGYRSTITVHAEDSMETLLQNILRYGTYGLVGYLVLMNYTTMEAGIEAIALSSSFYAAVLSAFQAIPEFGTAKVAEGRLSAWLVSDAVENDGTIDTSTAENLLVFDAVSYQYSERYAAISNFSETFEPGVTLVCGANGSGKSTLLKMAIGLLRVQSGTVTMKGIKPEYILPQSFPRDILFLPQEDLKISLSPLQFYEMVEGLSQEDAMQCAFSFGLTREQLEDGQIDQLSAGQRKKVYLAMAFAFNPSVLLLDEPGNGLDAQGEERLLSLLRDRKKTKALENSRITVVVTHDRLFDEAADYVVVLAERNTEEERA